MGSPLLSVRRLRPGVEFEFELGERISAVERDEERIQKLLKDGDDLAQSGRTQEAIEVWSEIFMIDVSNTEALQRIEAARNHTVGAG